MVEEQAAVGGCVEQGKVSQSIQTPLQCNGKQVYVMAPGGFSPLCSPAPCGVCCCQKAALCSGPRIALAPLPTRPRSLGSSAGTPAAQPGTRPPCGAQSTTLTR